MTPVSRGDLWSAPAVLRMDSPARRDMVTDMAIGLILENGLGAVTVRAVAGKIGIAAPRLLGWYGSADRVRIVVGQTYCHRWVQWVQRRVFRDGPLALLPPPTTRSAGLGSGRLSWSWAGDGLEASFGPNQR